MSARRGTPRTRRSSPRTQTRERTVEISHDVEEGEIIERDGRSKRRKIDTVEMVDTVEEINGYLQKLRIVLDQMETPKEVAFTCPMSEAYPDVRIKATLALVLDMQERPKMPERSRQQRNRESEETEDQISITSWALMQRDVYNVMLYGFKDKHMHYVNGIQQGDASALISNLQNLGAGFQEQIQKAELGFKSFVKNTNLTSLMAWKY